MYYKPNEIVGKRKPIRQKINMLYTLEMVWVIYYINKQSAKTFISIATHQKIELTIDWWHSYLAKENLLTVYWCFPTIVEQGSHNGMFNSAIDTKKRGVYYFIKFKIEKFYKKHIRILFK
jgi:GR25 family glycosyltransferase involved in LPS biosynthesis